MRRGAHATLRRVATGAACLAAAGLVACGSSESYENAPRPPKTIVITAAVLPDKVSVSPKEFGAGPISLVIANQTDASQRITIVREINGQPQPGEQTGPINPNDTATLKAEVEQGDYELRVEGSGIAPAKVTVGAARETAQNELLQP
jgi:hypothetical protein